MKPLAKFYKWYSEELLQSKVRIPSACCLSSIGFDGYPNSRFVSLKEILQERLVITGPVTSAKGIELLNDPKCALTFWWTETERQVRIQGIARPIENDLAEQYFKCRSRQGKIVSRISRQGSLIESYNLLIKNYVREDIKLGRREITMPKEWSGFYIDPVRIEYMKFEESRLHHRELFVKESSKWTKVIVQP